MKSKKIMLLPALLAVASAAGAEEVNAVAFWKTDGQKVTVLLDEQPKVTFTDDEMRVTTCTHEWAFPAGDVERFTYEWAGPTKIDTLLAMLSLATDIPAQNYLYIYRNDGNFNVFRKADIDSITWSRQDADGQEQQSWQAQWVHHKTGSVTRIPLSAIDHAATPQPAVGEAVDLGLSVKWASHNVGAASPEQYGGYYAWGETEEKTVYSEDSYAYYKSGTGYVPIGDNISGTPYDVARVKWGGVWRMPTLDEIKELINKCTWKWTTYKGVNGQLVTGPNGNSIFLPVAGVRWDEYLYNEGSYGGYWSGTLGSGSEYDAYYLFFYSGYGYCGNSRECSHTVRPVTE
mgnify:CR=1 FL=1